MKLIPLTQDNFATVDDDLFEYLNSYKWWFAGGYAIREIWHRDTQKKERVWMHRLINKTPKGFDTDHINRNRLDNRSENLRTATRSQNNMNTGLWSHNTSGYKGIHWRKQTNKWEVHIKTDSKKIHLGYYHTLQGAILARKWGERLYWHLGNKYALSSC